MSKIIIALVLAAICQIGTMGEEEKVSIKKYFRKKTSRSSQIYRQTKAMDSIFVHLIIQHNSHLKTPRSFIELPRFFFLFLPSIIYCQLETRSIQGYQ